MESARKSIRNPPCAFGPISVRISYWVCSDSKLIFHADFGTDFPYGFPYSFRTDFFNWNWISLCARGVINQPRLYIYTYIVICVIYMAVYSANIDAGDGFIASCGSLDHLYRVHIDIYRGPAYRDGRSVINFRLGTIGFSHFRCASAVECFCFWLICCWCDQEAYIIWAFMQWAKSQWFLLRLIFRFCDQIIRMLTL